MRNKFEAPSTALGEDGTQQRPGSVSWRPALLGAAVGVSGPAYVGTLIVNATLWVLTSRGLSVRDAYAYVGQFGATVPSVLNIVAEALFALGCGWVSAAYGKGQAIPQGIAAGLITTSFYLVMLANPTTPTPPLVVMVTPPAITMIGSVVGAWMFSRKSAR